MKPSIGFFFAVLLNVCTYIDAKDAKPILEEFKKDNSSIADACKAVGFVRSTCPPQNGNIKVAFTAAVTAPHTSWSSGTLIFDVVISNVGSGYNPKTGVFSAPVTGTYVFSVSAVEHLTQDLRVDIVLNNVPKVRLLGYTGAAFQTGTNLVVQQTD